MTLSRSVKWLSSALKKWWWWNEKQVEWSAKGTARLFAAHKYQESHCLGLLRSHSKGLNLKCKVFSPRPCLRRPVDFRPRRTPDVSRPPWTASVSLNTANLLKEKRRIELFSKGGAQLLAYSVSVASLQLSSKKKKKSIQRCCQTMFHSCSPNGLTRLHQKHSCFLLRELGSADRCLTHECGTVFLAGLQFIPTIAAPPASNYTWNATFSTSSFPFSAVARSWVC